MATAAPVLFGSHDMCVFGNLRMVGADFEYISVLEYMTEDWWDHSASEALYVRKMHYMEKHMAAYSFWPEQGWDGLFQDLSDAVTENGGEVRLGTNVERVVIENHQVKGVHIARQPRILPNEMFEDELIEADVVISTLPVWHVLKVVPEWELPDWYVGQIKHLAQDKFRFAERGQAQEHAIARAEHGCVAPGDANTQSLRAAAARAGSG